MNIFIAVAVVLAIVAIAFFLLSFSRRDTEEATGFVARETAKRDKANPTLVAVGSVPADAGASTELALSGRDLERAVAAGRRGGTLAPVGPAPIAVREAYDQDALGVTRRQFLNRSMTGLFVFGLSAFGAACIAFLWPTLKGGFGSKIRAGALEDVLKEIDTTKTPAYRPEGRFYLNPYPTTALAKAKTIPAYAALLPGYEAGVVALYQKCVHLGCRVPWCKSSQWFECPCHGSQYNRVGEKKDGPAPRGLDRFAVTVEGGQIIVDTKAVIPGPPLGTDTTGQQIEGPHCA